MRLGRWVCCAGEGGVCPGALAPPVADGPHVLYALQVVSVELKPGGADIYVTEENRREFVELYVEYILVGRLNRLGVPRQTFTPSAVG